MREYHANFSEEEKNELLGLFQEYAFKDLEDFGREEGKEIKVKSFGIGIAMTVEVNFGDHSELIRVTIS